MRRAALAACLALAAGMASAQAPPLELPSPVLTFDAERLLTDSALGRALTAEIEEAARRLAEENRRIETDLLAEERALTDRRATLGSEAFRPLAQAFDDKVQRLRAEQDEKERALADLREAGRQRFFAEAVPVLSDILRERGALVLLDRREVFLSADSIDITDAAIARLDAAPGSSAPP